MISYLFVLSLLVSINAIIIDTNYGSIEGIVEDGINKFLGIPYSKAPINELRFADPVEADPFNDIYSATTSPPTCPQPCFLKTFCPNGVVSEDCLYLNIYTPLNSQHQVTSYTTMVWIHGGAFEIGSINSFVYDATNFVEYIDDIIIVTINYRVGILGLLYDNMYDTGIDGNFGFKDQQLAIKWVYDNIEYFGGNPNNLIIFGESAGATYVGLHLLYNNEYINGGIMQSPPFGQTLRTPTTWYDTVEKFTDIIGCSDKIDDGTQLLDCWRSVDFNSIIYAQESDPSTFVNGGRGYTPTVDTQLLEKQIVFEFEKTNNDNIPPYIIGVNKDEYYLFVNESLKNVYSYSDLVMDLDEYFFGDNDVTQSILDYYGITNVSPSITDNYLYDLAEILTKGRYECPVHNILKNSKNIDNIYYYQFEVVDIEQNGFAQGQLWPQCINKSCHGIELYYLWLPPFFKQLNLLTPNAIQIGHQMQIWWTNWAKSLNPNYVDQQIWQKYTNKGDQKKQFLRIKGLNQYTTDSLQNNDQECNFWDHVVGYAGIYGPANSNYHSDSSEDKENP